LLTVAGIAAGLALLYLGLALARPLLDAHYGIWLPVTAPSPRELITLAVIVAAGLAIALLPALRAYRLSLADGMAVRA
jgi:putative ABC transport system permease protein